MAPACASPDRRASRSSVPSPIPRRGRARAHSSAPAGSAQSAPRRLRERCRQGLIQSETELRLPLHLCFQGCRSADSITNPLEACVRDPRPSTRVPGAVARRAFRRRGPPQLHMTPHSEYRLERQLPRESTLRWGAMPEHGARGQVLGPTCWRGIYAADGVLGALIAMRTSAQTGRYPVRGPFACCMPSERTPRATARHPTPANRMRRVLARLVLPPS